MNYVEQKIFHYNFFFFNKYREHFQWDKKLLFKVTRKEFEQGRRVYYNAPALCDYLNAGKMCIKHRWELGVLFFSLSAAQMFADGIAIFRARFKWSGGGWVLLGKSV